MDYNYIIIHNVYYYYYLYSINSRQACYYIAAWLSLAFVCGEAGNYGYYPESVIWCRTSLCGRYIAHRQFTVSLLLLSCHYSCVRSIAWPFANHWHFKFLVFRISLALCSVQLLCRSFICSSCLTCRVFFFHSHICCVANCRISSSVVAAFVPRFFDFPLPIWWCVCCIQMLDPYNSMRDPYNSVQFIALVWDFVTSDMMYYELKNSSSRQFLRP